MSSAWTTQTAKVYLRMGIKRAQELLAASFELALGRRGLMSKVSILAPLRVSVSLDSLKNCFFADN